jgi:DNA-binding XRE family transcriptional regulator
MPVMRAIEERFWEKVDVRGPDDCWPWTASTDDWGYGRIGERIEGQVQYRRTLAHHISWRIHNGAIPRGKIICHSCNTPICQNPKHLYAGTDKTNFEDQVRAGRYKPLRVRRGEEHPSAKLTDNQVREIRSRSDESRRELANEFSVTPQHIAALISGRCRPIIPKTRKLIA